MSTKKTTAITKPKRTYKRKIGLASLSLLGLLAGLGAASHIFPSFGAALADHVRAVVGPGPVAWAEDVTYGIEDRIKRVIYRDAPPKQFWDASPAAPQRPAAPLLAAPSALTQGPTQGPGASSGEPAPAFAPKPFKPPVPRADLVAAFNGGFKAEHGHFGMMIGGVALLPPRDTSCTIGLYKDGSLKIRTYPALKDSEGDMRAYRQTPPCLVEEGKINNRLLAAENTRGWGAAVGGDTVIRRSALGLDADGKTLFYGLGESVTADSLARAMEAAGAENAAQLDVNATYPRFLFYKHPANELPRVESAIIPDVDFAKHEYVGQSEGRDFFFLTRKHATS